MASATSYALLLVLGVVILGAGIYIVAVQSQYLGMVAQERADHACNVPLTPACPNLNSVSIYLLILSCLGGGIGLMILSSSRLGQFRTK